jgi:hypothetical protein
MLGGHDASYVNLVWIIASAFGVAALLGLVVVYRWAVRQAEVEHAEQVIAEHDQSSTS